MDHTVLDDGAGTGRPADVPGGGIGVSRRR